MDPLLQALVTVAALFVAMLSLERWIHRHLHGVSLLITGQPSWALQLYTLLLLPGVFLHEASHWLTARMLGVRTGRFSIKPKRQRDGSLRLGYVEYYRGPLLDPIRESLIGAAPLVWGIIAIRLIGQLMTARVGLQLPADLETVLGAALEMLAPRNWLWLFLLFSISSSMLPSPSDRRAWPLLLVVVVTALTVLVLLDATEIIFSLKGAVARLLTTLRFAFMTTLLIQLLCVALILPIEQIVGRYRGQRVDYR